MTLFWVNSKTCSCPALNFHLGALSAHAGDAIGEKRIAIEQQKHAADLWLFVTRTFFRKWSYLERLNVARTRVERRQPMFCKTRRL
jgi:hypothetical protein